MASANEYMPEHCPECERTSWVDLDLETGELYCFYCGCVITEEEEEAYRREHQPG